MRRLLATVGVVASTVCLLGGSAGAASAVESGWWQEPADPVDGLLNDVLGQGSSVSDGNLLVESDADGPTSVAAMRFRLAADETATHLRLTSGGPSNLNVRSVLLACAPETPWTAPAEAPGAWEERPTADAGTCTTGRVNGTNVVFDVADLVQDGDLDVVVVPGDGPDVRFEFGAPTGAALIVEQLASSPLSTDQPSRTASSASLSPLPAFMPSAPPRSSYQPSPAVAPSATMATDGQVEVASPVIRPTGATQPVAGPVAGALTEDGDPTLVGWVLLALSAAFAAWSYLVPRKDDGMIGLGRFRRPVPVTAEVAASAGWAEGSTADGPVRGGVGRFARDRSEPPIPLH